MSHWVDDVAPLGAMPCRECGARYLTRADSCAARFDALLALDHSRREPWGSRHGQAFAAFALQHPERHARSIEAAWVALYRIYLDNQPASEVFETLRRLPGAVPTSWDIPKRPATRLHLPEMTIANLGDFGASSYPVLLDSWCRATLASWGAAIPRRRGT
jgi:hypothetical protein